LFRDRETVHGWHWGSGRSGRRRSRSGSNRGRRDRVRGSTADRRRRRDVGRRCDGRRWRWRRRGRGRSGSVRRRSIHGRNSVAIARSFASIARTSSFFNFGDDLFKLVLVRDDEMEFSRRGEF
jgi:hypothetical protein